MSETDLELANVFFVEKSTSEAKIIVESVEEKVSERWKT